MLIVIHSGKADTYVASRKVALEKKLVEGGEEQRYAIIKLHNTTIRSDYAAFERKSFRH